MRISSPSARTMQSCIENGDCYDNSAVTDAKAAVATDAVRRAAPDLHLLRRARQQHGEPRNTVLPDRQPLHRQRNRGGDPGDLVPVHASLRRQQLPRTVGVDQPQHPRRDRGRHQRDVGLHPAAAERDSAGRFGLSRLDHGSGGVRQRHRSLQDQSPLRRAPGLLVPQGLEPAGRVHRMGSWQLDLPSGPGRRHRGWQLGITGGQLLRPDRRPALRRLRL